MVKKFSKTYLVGVLVAAVLAFSVFTTNLQAQKSKILESGVVSGVPYASTDFENINLTNGNLNFSFPLASLQGRGAAGYTYSLQYNSKLWQTVSNPVYNSGYTPNPTYQEFLGGNSEGGWQERDGFYPAMRDRFERGDYPTGNPCELNARWQLVYRWKLEMNFPDSSKVEFRPAGYSDIHTGGTNDDGGYFSVKTNGSVRTVSGPTNNCTYSDSTPSGARMTYYSSDGSGMRLTFANAEALGFVWELSMPDGSRVVQLSDRQRIIDRNGNYVESAMITLPAPYSTQAPGWVDQFGRYIAKKEGTAPDEDTYFQLGYDGVLLTWKVRWKNVYVKKNYTTTCNSCGGQRGPVIDSEVADELRVIDQIELPNALVYTFDYYAKDADDANESPGWGEIKSVTMPTGAKVTYSYKLSTFLTEAENESPEVEFGEIFLRVDQILERAGTINKKKLNYTEIYDNISTSKEELWSYGIGRQGSYVTAPDGGVTTQYYWDIVDDKQKGGQVYKLVNPDGSIIERVWGNNLPTGITYGSTNHFNPYVQKEIVTIPANNGSPALIGVKDYTIDGNGNQREVNEYDFLTYSSTAITRDSLGIATGVSGATLKRKTITDYYNSVTSNSANAYWSSTAPALRNLPKSTETQNGTGTPFSRAEIYYDYTTYGTNTKGGNVTETRIWDSNKVATLPSPDSNGYKLLTGNFIKTTAEYDDFGNPTLMKDAKLYETRITYGAVGGYTGLYPTQTISAYGTSVQRTSTAEYDFYTGRVKKVTDVDNAVSTESDYDDLGRPIIVKSAVNTPQEVWTQTFYDDVARRIIVKSDIETVGDARKVSIQHFDQLGRVRLSRTLENAATEDPINEQQGIKVQTRYLTANPYSYQLTSNPYRATSAAGASNEPEMGWTMTKSINTGKSSQVETFSGAALPTAFNGSNTNSTGVVKTDIDANRTLVTDQAGKKRISRTNSLGHLTDVWEVTAQDTSTVAVSFPTDAAVTYGYQTSYEYDALNNLTKVIQGTQQQNRTFNYTSLSRLKSAFNPESGTIQYQYDDNGNLTKKIDARLVETNYSYDALNRMAQRSYANEPAGQSATPTVTYTYDGVANAKGLLTKVSSSVSETSFTAFDKMGRVTASEQKTPFGTETITTATTRTSSYKYNLAGALIEQTYPSTRVVKNVLDLDGSLSEVQSKKSTNAGFWNYAQHFTYNAAGAVTSMQLGNGGWESKTFNSRMQPTQIALGSVQNGFDKLKLNYTYNTTGQNNNNGNVLSQTITVPALGTNPTFTAVQTYTYDSLNRIKDAKENINGSPTPEWKQTFTYDRYGNRTFDEANTTTLPKNCLENSVPAVCSADRAAVNPSASTTNNRLTGYSYDNAGNTKIDALGRQFSYDAENKQTLVKDQYGNTIGEYFYGGDGRRVKKKVGTETTIFVYDASGKLVAEYSNVVEPVETAKVSYLITDHLGSPRITSDKDGKVISRRDFMPFGEEIQRANYGQDNIREKFATYERDLESGLDYAQARYYASNLGRFTSIDPDNADAIPDIPQSWNAYSYARNNPLLYGDPSGLGVEVCSTKGERTCVYYNEPQWIQFLKANKQSGDYEIRGNKIYYGGELTAEITSSSFLNEQQTAFIRNVAEQSQIKRKTVGKAAMIAVVGGACIGTGVCGAVVTALITRGAQIAYATGPAGIAALNQLLNQAQNVTKAGSSWTQLTIKGNAQQIFNNITQGGTRLASGAVRLADGRIVRLYNSTTPGPLQGPTIHINDGGVITKIRIQ